MPDKKTHLFANDGTDWKSERGPEDPEKARKADEKVEKASERGDGPGATNERRLSHTSVAKSAARNAAADKK